MPLARADRLLNLAVFATGLGATLLLGTAARRQLRSVPNGRPRPAHVSQWRSIAASGSLLGSPAQGVTITVFSDFQCSYCSRFAGKLRTLRERYPRDVQVIFRHNPLVRSHPHAVGAAIAAVCAGRQGAFEAYHDALFAQQDSIGLKAWTAYARDAGIRDTAAFAACLASPAAEAQVSRDREDARRLGLTTTPSFLVNDTRFVGDYPLDTLDLFVRRATATR